MSDEIQELEQERKLAKQKLFDFIDSGGKEYAFTIKKIKNVQHQNINPDRLCAVFKNIYLTTPFTKDGCTIRDCSPMSIVNSIIKCAEWGLEPTNELAHLIPRKGILCAQLGYRGKVELCSRAGIRLTANNIFKNDEFSHAFGNNKFLVHKPKWLDRGAHLGSYSFALFEGGDFDFCVLSIKDMEANKKASKTDKFWSTHPLKMYRKTAIHMHYNYLPVTLKDSYRLPIEDEGNGIIIDHDIVDKFNLDSNIVSIAESAPDTADILVGELS